MDDYSGFKPTYFPKGLFDFQEYLVDWSVRKGRCAIFADCGLGKTVIQLAWAQNVVAKTNKPVLVLTPLAVSTQTIREAEKFGIGAQRVQDGVARPGINVTNYERLSKFNWQDFSGVVCDESSILKSFDGVRRGEITRFMRKLKYRLLCTATAAPNDYIELGTSSEALGYLGYMDMLNRFFKNDQNSSDTGRFHAKQAKWRFKGHSESHFWRWAVSWARVARMPSDLGFDDGQFVLPELREVNHIVKSLKLADGMLFAVPAVGLKEQRDERRRTVPERCEKVAEIVTPNDGPSLIWCHLNIEGDMLEKIVPDAVQVSGSDPDEAKEEKLIGFATGDINRLVTKPKIGAWGLNYQHCSHTTFFPSHSFEQYYQGVRRCWRFGQRKPVRVDVVSSEGEKDVMASLQRKAKAADKMFSELVRLASQELHIERKSEFTNPVEVPAWLQ